MEFEIQRCIEQCAARQPILQSKGLPIFDQPMIVGDARVNRGQQRTDLLLFTSFRDEIFFSKQLSQ